MATRIHLVGLALIAAACGGPPVGSHVPKANTKKMAIGAAAAATAITLIDPKSANRRPEAAEEEKPKKVKKTGENVPSGVFDRLDGEGAGAEPCDDPPGDTDADPDTAPPPGNDAVPKVVNETREARERERREQCLERAAGEADDD